MIIRNDDVDSEGEIEDEFTELLRQIEEQRQIERPLHDLEMREGSPLGHNEHHPPIDDSYGEDCCIHDEIIKPQQHYAKDDADGDLVASVVVSPLPKSGLPLSRVSGDDVACSRDQSPLTSSSVPQEPKFPAEETPSRKASPRKIVLKKIDRIPTTPSDQPSTGDEKMAAPPLGPLNTALDQEPINGSKMATTTRSSEGTMDEASRGTSTSPDSAMDILLEEIEGYVAENNILYHETSPEKKSESSNLLDPSSKGPLPAAESSFEVAKRGAGSSRILPVVDDGLMEGHTLTCKEEITDDTAQSQPPPGPPKRRVRFADDHGLPLLNVVHLDPVMATEGRLVVLLLSPPERTFEFIQVEYPMDDSTTINDLVEQLPGLATNAVFQETNCFVGMSRIRTLRSDCQGSANSQKPNSPDIEDDSSGSDSSSSSSSSKAHSFRLPTLLDAVLLMRDVDFGNCELVLAVLDGYTPAQMVTIAFPLLLNGKIMKAVQSGRRSGRGLKYVLSGKGWRKQQHQRALCLEEGRKDWHEQYTYKEWGVVDSLCDNVIVLEIDVDEYAESWDEMKALNGGCGMNGENEIEISTVWDDWWAEFKLEETFTVLGARAIVNEVDDEVENRRKDARSLDSVSSCESQPSSKQGDIGESSITIGEVSTAEKESSPRSVLDAPGIIVGKSAPFQVPDNILAKTDTLLTDPDPVLWGFIGGQKGAENVILMIYAFSIAGVAGLLSRA
jgi:hypothetical protein